MDLMAGLRSRFAPAATGTGAGAPRWAELHARFCAAHAAVAALARDGFALASVGGFDQWQRTASENSLHGVNRTDLADGKTAHGIVDGVANTFMADGRGK